MTSAFDLQLIAIFIILFTSTCGVCLPLICWKGISKENLNFASLGLLRSFSAGVLIGVAFIHLLADSAEDLPDVYPDYPPLVYVFVTTGIILVLALENIIAYHGHRDTSINSFRNTTVGVANHGSMTQVIEEGGAGSSSQIKVVPPRIISTEEKNWNKLSQAYVMEAAIAVHSIIIGISMGLMGEDEASELSALVVAMIFHQFFEGISLGTALLQVRYSLGEYKTFSFAGIFGATLPVGILIGMLIRMYGGTDEKTHDFITGAANAVAAGTLIYIALVEMIAEDFSHTHLNAKDAQKFFMVGAFALGVAVMAILAIWA